MLKYICNVAASCKLFVEAKKNLIQKMKKEKLPVDIGTSTQESRLDKGEQLVAVETDVTHNRTTGPKADINLTTEAGSSTQGVHLKSEGLWADRFKTLDE